jgi:putative phosphoesterase
MKKILVLSDTHGHVKTIEKIASAEHPFDAVIFSGDGLRDFSYITFEGNPERIFVPGNIDGSHPIYDADVLVRDISGKKVLIFHGHRHEVKNGLETALSLCCENGADFCIFGHTHIQFLETIRGVTLLNPGTVTENKYAVIHAGESWDISLRG